MSEEIKCTECERTFKNKGALMMHMRSHEPHTPVAMTSEEFMKIAAATYGNEPEELYHMEPDPMKVKIKKLPNYSTLPDMKKATPGAAGIDVYAAIKIEQAIGISSWALIDCGFAIEVPEGHVAMMCPRSGLAANNGITLLNAPGIIDSDYRGEVKCIVVNNTTTKFRVTPGMRLGQMVILKLPEIELEYVKELSDTSRGQGGFGSTGR
jgi:dUTP pyrophosphatase